MISEITSPPTGTELRGTAYAELVSNESRPIDNIMETLWLEVL